MAVTVAHFSAFEVLDVIHGTRGVFATRRIRTVISMVGMEAGVDVAPEAFRAVEPGANSDEDAAGKPFRSVVTVGSAVEWCNVIVAIRAFWGGPDFDGDLGLGLRTGRRETESGDSDDCE